jgi:hypothetical protein
MEAPFESASVAIKSENAYTKMLTLLRMEFLRMNKVNH